MSSPDSLMYRLFALRDELNGLVRPIDGVEILFEPMSLHQPRFTPAELGFVRSTSWLFGLYYEAGKIGVAFTLKYLQVYGLDDGAKHAEHYKIVRDLRTYLVHNLDLNELHDQKVINDCQKWFKQRCKTVLPSTEEHWTPLLLSLLSEAVDFMQALCACVRKIEADANVEMICRQWSQRLKRYHPPHVFDDIIPGILQDIGITEMDPMRLRKKYYTDWSRKFETYAEGYDFLTEATKLVESAALAEQGQTLPITGKDVMEYFALPPGPEIKDLLELAKNLYANDRCDKPALLARLAESVKATKPD